MKRQLIGLAAVLLVSLSLGSANTETLKDTRMEVPKLVDPSQPLLDGYVIDLPFPMARRVEDGSLVFWHSPKGLTFWIDAYKQNHAGEALDEWKRNRSADAKNELIERSGSLLRYSYRLAENDNDGRQPAFYGFVAEDGQEFLIAAYFNTPEMIDSVIRTWRSIRRDK